MKDMVKIKYKGRATLEGNYWLDSVGNDGKERPDRNGLLIFDAEGDLIATAADSDAANLILALLNACDRDQEGDGTGMVSVWVEGET